MFFRAFTILCLLACSAAAQQANFTVTSADCVPSLQVQEVPRAERRQQILAGIHESRFNYTVSPTPFETDLFAECYLDGKMTHRLQLTSAMHWNKPEYAKGTISLGWDYLRHEMTLINDNSFGLWNSRIPIAHDAMDEPFVVVGAEHPQAEQRDTLNDYPAKQVTIYPIIGLIGESPNRAQRKTHFELSTTEGFLGQAGRLNCKQCIIVYLFSNAGGGNPPFTFDEKAQFYVHSLPMN